MDTPRKILILHASAGHGHEKAARAVEEACHALFPDVEVAVADTLSLMPRFIGAGYKKSYLFLIQKLPWLWGFFYYFFDNAVVYALAKPCRRFFNGFFCRGIETLAVSLGPDVVICTHFMSTEVINALKKTGKIRAFLITAITDFRAHRFWLGEAVDRYAVADPSTRESMICRGVSPDRIVVTGIPVDKKFSLREGREKLRKEFGLESNKFTVLVTSGGGGVGSMDRILKGLSRIRPEIQILVVCGQNKLLFDRLRTELIGSSAVRLFGFVDFMDRLMETADILVGKSGGLTVSESLCKGAPLVVFEPVPGQETANALYVQAHGAGLIARSSEEVVRRVGELSSDAAFLGRLKAAAVNLAKPDAARKVAEMARYGHG
ncbi:MAG: hypothetical protein HYT89_06040 [Candidatus Omnitrophica bacterium]|nr:hypothetical protein [Candidatus Omnitrophota bacterium]